MVSLSLTTLLFIILAVIIAVKISFHLALIVLAIYCAWLVYSYIKNTLKNPLGILSHFKAAKLTEDEEKKKNKNK